MPKLLIVGCAAVGFIGMFFAVRWATRGLEKMKRDCVEPGRTIHRAEPRPAATEDDDEGPKGGLGIKPSATATAEEPPLKAIATTASYGR